MIEFKEKDGGTYEIEFKGKSYEEMIRELFELIKEGNASYKNLEYFNNILLKNKSNK